MRTHRLPKWGKRLLVLAGLLAALLCAMLLAQTLVAHRPGTFFTPDYAQEDLSTLLAQTAGLPMTQYQKYLSVLYQSLPVIDLVGYIDSDGEYYESGAETPYDDLLHQYNCIEYNALLDKTDRDDSLFYLQE